MKLAKFGFDSRRSWVAALLASVICALSSPASAVTGKDVVEACADYPNGPRRNSCEFYIHSMVIIVTADDSLSNPKGRLCIAEGFSMPEMVQTISAWLAAHPELHSKSGYDATYGALAPRFRCR